MQAPLRILPVVETLPKDADVLSIARSLDKYFGEITPEKYRKSCTWGSQKVNDFLRRHGMILPKDIFRFSSYRFELDSLLLYTEVDNFETSTLDDFSAEIFTDGDSLVANLLSRDDLAKYFRMCREVIVDRQRISTKQYVSPYTFWVVSISPTILQDYKSARSIHACLIIFNHITQKIYYMDPNATWSFLDGSNLEMTQYVDIMLSKYFENTDYEYVFASAWRPSTSIQKFPDRLDYDNGNCLTLSTFIAHLLLIREYIDPEFVYKDILSLISEQSSIIYNYICYVYDVNMNGTTATLLE